MTTALGRLRQIIKQHGEPDDANGFCLSIPDDEYGDLDLYADANGNITAKTVYSDPDTLNEDSACNLLDYINICTAALGHAPWETTP